MKHNKHGMDWVVSVLASGEEGDGLGLDESELNLIEEMAQSPELSDPLLFFLPPGGSRGERETFINSDSLTTTEKQNGETQ